MFKKETLKETFSSLSIRNYRLYQIGQTISNTGTWIQTIGQSWLVLELTNSGTALGITIALQFLPLLVIGPWGGTIADRFPKRKLLYITQTTSGFLALILGLLVVSHTAELWMVYVLALLLGLVSAVDNPARNTFIPEMVGKSQLLNAISLNAIQVNITRVIGPAIAASMIATFGLGALFICNAISYIAVIIALSMMDMSKLHTHPPVAAERVHKQILAGFKYVRETPIILNTLIMMAIVGTFTYEFTVSLPLLAQFTFSGNAVTYAWLSGALGAGSVIGGLVTATRKKTGMNIYLQTSVWFGLATILLAVSPTFVTAVIVTAIVGYFAIYFLSVGNVILQHETRPDMRGRVMALWAMAFLGTTPIGGPIIGWLSDTTNPRWGLAIGGIAALIAAWIGARALKKAPKQETTGTV